MNLSNIYVGDIVLCDVKGRRFYALVEGKEPRALNVDPISRASWRRVKSTEVIAHFRRSKSGVRRGGQRASDA